MNVLSIIILVAVCGLTTWLLVDTVIWFVKKLKKKKQEKKETTTKE